MQDEFFMNKVEEALQILHSQHEVFDKQVELLGRIADTLDRMEEKQQSLPPVTVKKLAELATT